jgi:hypothetical protein
MITSGENGKPLQPPKKASPSIEVVANWPILARRLQFPETQQEGTFVA